MKHFISFAKKGGVLVFWLIVWETVARAVDNIFILVGPVEAFGRLFELAGTLDFWTSIRFSILRVFIGFLLSMSAGVALAVACSMSKLLNALITPAINVIKSVPVASFALLLVISLNPSHVSVVISFITVLPIIFFNTFKGIQNTDKNLLEMAKVFRVNIWRKIRHIYLPSVAPFVVSAAESGLGFAWKAAITGEIVSLATREGIGGSMQAARSWLMTADIWAWTIVIIALSFLMEKIFFLAFRRIKKWQ